MFLIELTPLEWEKLVKQHPELVNKTRVADNARQTVKFEAYTHENDDDWLPVDEGVKRRYRRFKRRLRNEVYRV